ncbi:ABC transporter substrate-binding protein [Desmospora profundinema]|uniref:Raffinose/stachyose/melibiose transport system substrate-binding protein n=1 Tax=Desmospora profundinema TaxID=1571184 RepID=A0ABU1IJY3_9BACL|nr:extracellular solute-binding protein [Desmospora profundinema]MDR6225087.1 raffinose/stachyose/melibiose transport system substrate-binding protein [Desmospora profundinema]
MRKWLAVFLSLSLGVLVLAGCGSNAGKNDDGKVQLELFSNKSENVETYKEMIREFEKQNPDIKIKLTSPPEAETVIKARLTKNDLPDLMAIGGNATYGELARAGVLKDFSEEAVLDGIQPAYTKMIGQLAGDEVEGVYGIPYATNANTVIYNKEKFEKLGVDIPKTWDEFVEILEKADAAGETPIYFTLKDSWTAMIPWNSLAANTAGEDFAEKKNEDKTSFKKAYGPVADKMLQLLEYGHNDNFGVGYGDGNNAFAKGKSVMYLQGNWAIPEIKKANPDLQLGVFALPVTNDPEKNKLVSGVDVLLAMKADIQHPEEAMKWIEFMLDHENAQGYIDEQAAFSALEDVFQEEPTMEGIKVHFETGRITSFPDHYYPPGMQADNLIQDFLIKKDKEAFLNKMDQEWNKVINR